jgi:hypothetical protein
VRHGLGDAGLQRPGTSGVRSGVNPAAGPSPCRMVDRLAAGASRGENVCWDEPRMGRCRRGVRECRRAFVRHLL